MFTPEKIIPILKPIIDAKFYHTSNNFEAKGTLRISRHELEEIFKLYQRAKQYAQK